MGLGPGGDYCPGGGGGGGFLGKQEEIPLEAAGKEAEAQENNGLGDLQERLWFGDQPPSPWDSDAETILTELASP